MFKNKVQGCSTPLIRNITRLDRHILTILTIICFLNSRGMLEFHKSDGIGAVGGIKWELLLCLLAVLLVVYFSLWKGVKTSGKVANNGLFHINCALLHRECLDLQHFLITLSPGYPGFLGQKSSFCLGCPEQIIFFQWKCLLSLDCPEK